MGTRNLAQYLARGVSLFRDNPQLWFTALTAVLIFGAFTFIAHRFASIAQDAHEELINVRIGSIFDALVLFIPDSYDAPDVLRARFAALRAENQTIDSLMLLAPHGASAWRVYVSDHGAREGSVIDTEPIAVRLAKGDPTRAYTVPGTDEVGERTFMTARAIADEGGLVEAVVVSSQKLSAAEQVITDSLRTSTFLLVGIILAGVVLFFRHARIVDFATLYRKQLEVDELKDSFIGMASHELKSPLTVIRGYIELLKEGGGDAAAQHEYLRRIDVSADELRQLIDDILDVSRIEMGRMRFTPEMVEPEGVLREVCDMFQTVAAQKKLTLSYEADASAQGATVELDRGRLKQVVVNLVSNALKYTPAGSVRVEALRTADRYELSVRDTGVGMTAEESAKLFTKFYRITTDETKGIAGTGLGLWITKYLVEHMGGTISAESIKGEGSRFVVSFPLRKVG